MCSKYSVLKIMGKVGRTLVFVAVPVVIVFSLFNFYLLNHFNKNSSATTFILNERVYNKHSDSSSEKEVRNAGQRAAINGQDVLNARNGGQGTNKATDDELGEGKVHERDLDDKELVEKSEKDEENSPNEKNVDKNGKPVSSLNDPIIDKLIDKLKQASLRTFFPSYFWNMTMYNLTRKLGGPARKNARTLAGYKNIQSTEPLQAWKLLHRNIRQFSLYDPDDPNLETALKEMTTLPFVEADENDGGTQLKINVRMSNDGRAVLKPMRYGRKVEADENRYIFDDMERHVAEIAAFQLDNVLGFYRVPPTIGRLVNISSELKPIVPKSIHKTFYISPAGNICFYGECSYYCDSGHAFCGHPDMIEVSAQMYLPSRNIAKRKSWYQPWRRSYSKFRKAYWEENTDMCSQVRNEDPYNNGKILLDMIDAHTFDFLTGNKDRHSFATFKEFGNYTFPIMYDNGRGFGRQTYDAMSILAPLRQCCLIRKSTLLKYLRLYLGPERLSTLMEKALATDPIAPVLIQPHLDALDRRLNKILLEVAKCIETIPVDKVIIYDRF